MDSLNKRSCLLDSFAHIIGCRPEWFALAVGHTGAEGYHSQECIEVALKMGYAVTTIERKPVAQNPEDGSMRLVSFNQKTAEERFGWALCHTQGVLMGRMPFTNKPHAVAWDDPWISDPGCDQKYSLLDGYNLVNDTNFIPMIYLRIDKL
jgi:hypothetical protein